MKCHWPTITRFGHIARAEVREGNRPVEYLCSITVEDASGAQFVAYEFRRRSFLLGESCFELDTGEPLDLIDGNTFAIATTGERLMRV